MKASKRTVLLIILAITLIFMLTACDKQVQVKTNLTINNDFSGTRVMDLVITKDSFNSNSSKSIEEVTALLNANCPPEMTLGFIEAGGSYKYILTIEFESQEAYTEKIQSIIGEEAISQISMPNTVFASGIAVHENFSSKSLLEWVSHTLYSNNVTSRSDIFQDNGATVNAKGKIYQVGESKISISDLDYTKVNSIDVYTEMLDSEKLDRVVSVRIPIEEWSIKEEKIREYVTDNTPKECSLKIEETSTETSVVFFLENIQAEELETKMKRILDTDLYTIEYEGKAQSDTTISEAEDLDQHQKPFTVKMGYTEYLDLESYAGSSSGEVFLRYYIKSPVGASHRVQYYKNGEYKSLPLIEEEGFEYGFVEIANYRSSNMKVQSQVDYVADLIQIKTDLGKEIIREVVLYIFPEPSDSHREIILNKIKEYSNNEAVVVYTVGGGSDSIESAATINITIGGNVDEFNNTIRNLFGPSNHIEYFTEKGFFKFRKGGFFKETTNFENFITCNASGVSYTVSFSGGQKIDKVTDYSDEMSSLGSSNKSYETYFQECAYQVAFSTTSFNYLLLILIVLLAAVVILSALSVFKKYLKKNEGSTDSKKINFDKIKVLLVTLLTKVKSKTGIEKGRIGGENQILRTSINDEASAKEVDKKVRLGMKILILIAEICFFIPMFAVSCLGNSVEINGAKIAFGFEAIGQHVEGNLLFLLLLLLPILMAALLLIKKFQKGITAELSIGLMSSINLVLLILLRLRITTVAQENMLEIEYRIGYYLALVSYLLLLVGSGALMWLKRKKIKTEVPGEEKQLLDDGNKFTEEGWDDLNK